MISFSVTFSYKIAVDLFFTKKQKQNNRHCKTSYVTSMVCTLIDHSSQPVIVIVIVKITIIRIMVSSY